MGKILEEIQYYTRSNQTEIVLAAVQTISKIALKNKKMLSKATKILIEILKNGDSANTDEVVLALAQIINDVS